MKQKNRSGSRSEAKTRAGVYWSANIEEATVKNRDWRRVIYTSPHLQVVLMSVPPRTELGWEMHKNNDQFFRLESGRALVEFGNKKGHVNYEIELKDGMSTVVPEKTWHNVINLSSSRPLKFYTVYGPPHHPKNRRDRSKSDEEAREYSKKRK